MMQIQRHIDNSLENINYVQPKITPSILTYAGHPWTNLINAFQTAPIQIDALTSFHIISYK